MPPSGHHLLPSGDTEGCEEGQEVAVSYHVPASNALHSSAAERSGIAAPPNPRNCISVLQEKFF